MFRLIFIIDSGSFAGGVSRFLTSRFIQNQAASTFPFGTFVVNILGCFLIGLFYDLSERGNLLDAECSICQFKRVSRIIGYLSWKSYNQNTVNSWRRIVKHDY